VVCRKSYDFAASAVRLSYEGRKITHCEKF